MKPSPILEFERIEKCFSGVRVLREVSFTVKAGATLGLVGENGAGKSTLMNILGGNLQPDAGCMRLAGERYAPGNPQEASVQGVGFVHQELNLFPNLTIAENLFLRSFPKHSWLGLGLIHRKATVDRAAALLAQVGLALPADTLVERLSPGERQLVEIAKAISSEARLLILDEPTTSLTARETEHLFELLQSLQAQGVSMIYISHNLGDVLRLCDQVVVLRDGEVAGAGARGEFNIDQLVSLMVGRSIQQLFPPRSTKPRPETVLEVKRVSQPGMVHEISFCLQRGEVLGIAGLMGSGRSELARIIFGLDPFLSGEILVAGLPRGSGPRASIEQGLAFLTEDRREEGLCMEASIADNIALVSLARQARLPMKLIDPARQRDDISKMRQAVRISGAVSDAQPVKTLSGGNQQKVVLAKWLLAAPSVFLLDEPTRGIDVGAKVEVYGLINQLAEGGAGVLVISSELEELMGICDRILVLNQGEIRDEVTRPQFDRERLLRSALHARQAIAGSHSLAL